MLGVSFGLADPATVAVVDMTTQKVIAYRTIRQLLGKNYPRLVRHRSQQQRNAKKRHENQQKGAFNSYTESKLGEYVDRLIAKAIVELAKHYRVSSIVLPDLGDIRESIQAEVWARAEQKIPGCLEAQRQYVKQYRASVHKWSYGRLRDSIVSKASQAGISIESVKQPCQDNSQEKARRVAISAYQKRLNREVS